MDLARQERSANLERFDADYLLAASASNYPSQVEVEETLIAALEQQEVDVRLHALLVFFRGALERQQPLNWITFRRPVSPAERARDDEFIRKEGEEMRRQLLSREVFSHPMFSLLADTDPSSPS
jgi:hypothetical protein